jgi:hypothetical protein
MWLAVLARRLTRVGASAVRRSWPARVAGAAWLRVARSHRPVRLAVAIVASLLAPAGLVHYVTFDPGHIPELFPFILLQMPETGEVTDARGGVTDFTLAYCSKGTLVRSAALRMRGSTEFDAQIYAAAALHGVRGDLVRAIIQVESDFDRQAVSAAGARGLMQLMPATARRFGVTDGFDARQNIFAGTRYLRTLLDTYGDDVSLSAAAYNAGEGAVARYGGIPPFRETQSFVRKVNALLGGVVDASASRAPAGR